MTIAVVVPTIRYDTRYKEFLEAWEFLFHKHKVTLITIEDGLFPIIHHDFYDGERILHLDSPDISIIMGKDIDLIPCLSPACRNLGFLFIAKHLISTDTIITLDDDVVPGGGDPISDHVNALHRNVPVSWMASTVGDPPLYMRGFPYGVRQEAEVWVSHGVWYGVPDMDAPTQMIIGEHPDVSFYRGPVPKEVMFPICGMNLAFDIQALPYVYYAPVVDLKGAERFDDIWMGIHLKKKLDRLGKALVTGFAAVHHDRASNVFVNLNKEHYGIQLNETYWQGWQPDRWFKDYDDKRLRWEELTKKYLGIEE